MVDYCPRSNIHYEAVLTVECGLSMIKPTFIKTHIVGSARLSWHPRKSTRKVSVGMLSIVEAGSSAKEGPGKCWLVGAGPGNCEDVTVNIY